MEPMKVSFGFNKTSKRINIIPSQAKQEVKKVELIDCLEGQSIKVKDAVEEVKQPLVIPLKDDQKNLLDRVRAAKKRDRQEESKKNEEEDIRPDSELSVDELAARQLIREAKDRLTNGHSSNNSKISVLPLKQDPQSLGGEKEPTLDDYESVPINDYGLAILRGMGWKEGMAIGKNSKLFAASIPELRPKGLGLGATKVVQSEMPEKKAVDKDGKELILVKGAFAKVIAGPHKGHYCEVQGFDEEAGRVIIIVHPSGDIVNINEFMLSPVTKEEFSKGSKILNNAKYEEYKEISDKKLDNYKVKQESSLPRKIKEENNSSDLNGDSSSTKTERNRRKEERKKTYSPETSENEHEKKSSKNKEQSKTTSKHRESVSSDRDHAKRNSRKKDKSKSRSDDRSPSYYKEQSKTTSKHRESASSDRDHAKRSSHKKDKSSSRCDDRSPSYSSSKYRSHKRHGTDSSDSEHQKKDKARSSVKQKSKSSRSRSRSRYSSSKKDNTKYISSDDDHYEKVKRSSKHSKSKNRDRSRSKSGDRHRKNKSHSSRHGDSSESDSGKKERRKKNKCKSRHRRNSSSSSEDRQYRSNR